MVRNSQSNSGSNPGPLVRWAREQLLARLRGLEHGQIVLEEGSRRQLFGTQDPQDPIRVTLVVEDARFYTDLAFRGTLGAGEAYMAGYWSADDLSELTRLVVKNAGIMEGLDRIANRVAMPFLRIYHWLNRNSRAGSQRNIARHYDLGNDFFSLVLDPTLTYSCGIFENRDSTLEEASISKYDRICRKLRLAPGQRLLEIGTGWGGFALHAAQRYGAQVTTTTISREQHERASERIQRAGLSDRVTLLLEDYRNLSGLYDRLVSIEMIEAVGERYFDTYFSKCSSLLEADGLMLIQAITVPDRRYASHVRSVDFIKRYIFPGGCLPSVERMMRAVMRGTDLRLSHLEDITPHYAQTLRRWRESLLANVERIRSLGYPQRFVRMFEFYFAYCEGAFEERWVGDVQLLFAKPECRDEIVLGSLA